MTPCVSSPGVCIRQRLLSYPSSPASHHPTSDASHMSPILPKQPLRTRITYFTSKFLLLPQFPCSVSGHAGLLSAEFDMHKVWNNHVDHIPSSVWTTCPPPSSSLPPGADLPRKQWVRLNRLRSGTAHVGKTLHCWGMQIQKCACVGTPHRPCSMW